MKQTAAAPEAQPRATSPAPPQTIRSLPPQTAQYSARPWVGPDLAVYVIRHDVWLRADRAISKGQPYTRRYAWLRAGLRSEYAVPNPAGCVILWGGDARLWARTFNGRVIFRTIFHPSAVSVLVRNLPRAAIAIDLLCCSLTYDEHLTLFQGSAGLNTHVSMILYSSSETATPYCKYYWDKATTQTQTVLSTT